MSKQTNTYLKFGAAIVVIVVSLGFLAYTGVQESKSYYVTIKELHGMGDDAYTNACAWLAMFSPVRSNEVGPRCNLCW